MKLETFLLGCSPLPFRTEIRRDSKERDYVGIDSSGFDAVADMCGRERTMSKAKSNGAYLVHAANSLQSVTRALRLALERVVRETARDEGTEAAEILPYLETALAASEEVKVA